MRQRQIYESSTTIPSSRLQDEFVSRPTEISFLRHVTKLKSRL